VTKQLAHKTVHIAYNEEQLVQLLGAGADGYKLRGKGWQPV